MKWKTKVGLLFSGSAVAQAALLIGLTILQIETVERYPLRALYDRQRVDYLNDLILDDWALLRDLKTAIEQKALPDSWTEDLKNLTTDRDNIVQYWENYPEKRQAVEPFFEPSAHQQLIVMAGQLTAIFNGLLSVTTQAAATVERLVQPLPPDRLAELVGIEASAKQQVAAANNQLIGILKSGYEQPFGPEGPAKKREGGMSLIFAYSIVNVIALLVFGLLTVLGLLKSLHFVSENSQRLVARQPLLTPTGGLDEISELDKQLHNVKVLIDNSTEVHKLVMDNTVDLICTIDAQGRISSVSKAALNTIGYSPDDLLGTRLIDLIQENSQPRFLETIREVVSTRNRASFEAAMVTAGGKNVELLWSAAYFDEDNSVFCITHDISETKRAERLQQELVQMVSHDLRSPLTSISGFHEFAERGMLGDFNAAGMMQLQSAKQHTQQMLTLVNDLLEVERLDSGMLNLTKEHCLIDTLFTALAGATKAQAFAKNVKIQIQSSASAVFADEVRLIQALTNLAIICIQRSAEGNKVVVDARPSKNATLFSITDFAARSMDESVGSIELAEGKQQSVLGLKLTIAKAIVSLHGSRIDVDTTSGVGTTFSFEIKNVPGAVSGTTRMPKV